MKAISCLLLLLTLNQPTRMNTGKPYTMLCLGDSYTIGEAVDEKDRFPMQAVELLKQHNIPFATPTIIAKTGWTTDELAAAIKEQNLTNTYDYVTLLIGVNNQYRGRDLDNYRQEFTELLHTAISYAGGNKKHVFIISIPDWGVTPFGHADKRGEEQLGKEIDQYNTVNKQVAQNEGITYIDITPHSRLAKTDAALIATDGLHPSGKMYTEWAEKLAAAIQQLVK
ncbi:MAG TPA: SGNH/GDSL hydrolase family protein [Chitinophagales bacterium]|nr:SGNH/GDSL hydrolase family protein [Chitinophagales bacterium]